MNRILKRLKKQTLSNKYNVFKKIAAYNNTYIRKDNILIKFEKINNICKATKLTFYGCTFNDEYIKFNSADEGNEYYKKCIEEGFYKISEEEYEKIYNFCMNQ